LDLPASVAAVTGWSTVELMPVQLHMLWLALFASLVAPFGGFFASAIKRAYKVKDFDSVLPGRFNHAHSLFSIIACLVLNHYLLVFPRF
jgi:predicted CDP-diglyceride synthetase/phosphatidate cytidylyltransferase